jgi:hypothetical protein
MPKPVFELAHARFNAYRSPALATPEPALFLSRSPAMGLNGLRPLRGRAEIMEHDQP